MLRVWIMFVMFTICLALLKNQSVSKTLITFNFTLKFVHEVFKTLLSSKQAYQIFIKPSLHFWKFSTKNRNQKLFNAGATRTLIIKDLHHNWKVNHWKMIEIILMYQILLKSFCQYLTSVLHKSKGLCKQITLIS